MRFEGWELDEIMLIAFLTGAINSVKSVPQIAISSNRIGISMTTIMCYLLLQFHLEKPLRFTPKTCCFEFTFQLRKKRLSL